MNTKTIESLALSVAVAFCAQYALAQESGRSSDSDYGKKHEKHHESTSATDASGMELRLSKVKGVEVKSNTGESLGKIDDVFLDPMSGKVGFAILGRGGVLGIGEKRIPVPWRAFTIVSEKEFTLNMDKEKLKGAPTVKSDYVELNDTTFLSSVYTFFGVEQTGLGAGLTPGGTSSGTSDTTKENKVPEVNK